MKSADSLVVFGSFGYGNVGDEAVPVAISDLLASIDIELDVKAVSRFSQVQMDSVISLGQLDEKKDALDGCPVIISGGGIVEPNKGACISRYLDYLKVVNPSKTTLLAGSFEFGVNYDWSSKRRIRKALSQCDRIYTRDYISELFFHEEFPECSVSTLGDVVLGMRPAESSDCLGALGGERFMSVSLCGVWRKSESWYAWVSQELVKIAKENNALLLFVPMSCCESDDDRVVHKEVAQRCRAIDASVSCHVIEAVPGPREVSYIYKQSLLVIAMRLHSCVMAYAQETPFVSLAYHPKLLGFTQTVGWREFVVPRSLQQRQDAGAYGYKFESLDLNAGDLEARVAEALNFSNFKLLPILRNNLKLALIEAVS